MTKISGFKIFASNYHVTLILIYSLARLEYCLQLAAMLDSLLGVQHHHRVAPDDSHPDGVPLSGL